MSYFRKLEPGLSNLQELLSRNERWLIMINADPDAMASALALKRIMSHRVADVGIARVNEVTRPDNIAMARYLRIPMMKLTPAVAAQYDRFAIVDSQPHHHPLFCEYHFSIVFDHHPVSEEHTVVADFKDIKPEYGSNSTLMTEYLYNMGIRPGKLLATALAYGIKTDTSSFEREFCDVDVRAFRYLSKFADQYLLSRIARSEFHLGWLDYFSTALNSFHSVGTGRYAYVGEVENPDALVVIADFFMRVHEIRWVSVVGVYQDKLVIIFRGDGVTRDLGQFASLQFGDIGSAGGHRAMARAEIPLKALGKKDAEMFVFKRLMSKRKKPKDPAQETEKDAAKDKDSKSVAKDASSGADKAKSADENKGKASGQEGTVQAGTGSAVSVAPEACASITIVSDSEDSSSGTSE